jgi:hypothetical protein
VNIISKCSAAATQKRSLHPNRSEAAMPTQETSDDLEILCCDFGDAADRTSDPSSKACFAQLISTVADIPTELLDAYMELFEGLTDSETHQELLDEIRQGFWFPQSATEFVQRFIARETGSR